MESEAVEGLRDTWLLVLVRNSRNVIGLEPIVALLDLQRYSMPLLPQCSCFNACLVFELPLKQSH